MSPDKFTLPLVYWLDKKLPGYHHRFLFIEAPRQFTSGLKNSEITWLHTPHRKNLLHNLIQAGRWYAGATKVIIHGTPGIYLLWLLRKWKRRPIYWVIYGGSDLGTEAMNAVPSLQNWLRKMVLQNTVGHITHIEGDSVLANRIFNSSAIFMYNPAYNSNVVNLDHYISKEFKGNVKYKILLGNSSDPRNGHLEALEWLLPYKEAGIQVYCPLSYPSYEKYKHEVIARGKALFGDQFIPLLDFIPIDAYRKFLSGIDVGVFNHKTQAAMGVTIALLAMGKKVYLWPEATSYKSLVQRGFRIFDLNKGCYDLLQSADTLLNRKLVAQYYSEEILMESWKRIYSHKLYKIEK